MTLKELTTNSVFIVAELSANHNGKLETALETVRAAKRTGADAIKLQTYTADTMTLDAKNKHFLLDHGTIWDGKYLHDLYQEAYTPWEWHQAIFDEAKKEGLICFSTPFDNTAVDFLESIGNPIYKIASFEITDIPLIKYAASQGKPIIISTGIATKEDIELAINACHEMGNNNISLLKCTSSYPAPIEEANLVMIKEFQDKYGVIPGLSDHTMGATAPIVATALGARVIEKHFILDRSIGGPDASFSMNEHEFTDMVSAVRDAEKAIGKINYTPSPKSVKGRAFSRSLFISADVKAGDTITIKNIKCVRPNVGLAPIYLDAVLGKTFVNDFIKGEPLTKNMFK